MSIDNDDSHSERTERHLIFFVSRNTFKITFRRYRSSIICNFALLLFLKCSIQVSIQMCEWLFFKFDPVDIHKNAKRRQPIARIKLMLITYQCAWNNNCNIHLLHAAVLCFCMDIYLHGINSI